MGTLWKRYAEVQPVLCLQCFLILGLFWSLTCGWIVVTITSLLWSVYSWKACFCHNNNEWTILVPRTETQLSFLFLWRGLLPVPESRCLLEGKWVSTSSATHSSETGKDANGERQDETKFWKTVLCLLGARKSLFVLAMGRYCWESQTDMQSWPHVSCL